MQKVAEEYTAENKAFFLDDPTFFWSAYPYPYRFLLIYALSSLYTLFYF